MKLSISSLCLPSKIYLGLAILSIVFSLIISIETVYAAIIHFLFAVFWTWVLNLICKSGFSIVSWILVLVPIIFYIILVFYSLYIIRKTIKNEIPSTKNTN
jgi:hypothetical protein